MPFECVAVGDSIAVGTGAALGCETYAKVGAPSSSISGVYTSSGMCIISAGSNDPTNPRLRANLIRIRGGIKCPRVLWILPMHSGAARVVRQVAAKFGDGVVGFTPGRDRVHPKSYKALANKIRALKEEK